MKTDEFILAPHMLTPEQALGSVLVPDGDVPFIEIDDAFRVASHSRSWRRSNGPGKRRDLMSASLSNLSTVMPAKAGIQ